jgi:uncharacterized protein (DUF1330 family)
MTAYFVAFGTVKNAELLAHYIEASSPIVEAFGGRFMGASDDTHVLLGEHPHGRTALFEFPDIAACKAWYSSEAYRGVWAVRQQAADFVFLVFEPGRASTPVP